MILIYKQQNMNIHNKYRIVDSEKPNRQTSWQALNEKDELKR